MTLHIEDPEAERIVRELAAMTGSSFAEVIIAALREKLTQETGREQSAHLVRDLALIQNRVAKLPVIDDGTPDEIPGYDEHGLPK